MTANTVQIPPSSVPVIDARGFMTAPWRQFFEALLTRTGGINAGLQPGDATLDALAALSASVGAVVQTGADAFTKVAGVSGTKTPPASITVSNGIVTALS